MEFECEGVRRSVTARKEVVLSAGAYGSPQLLLLSGVGEASVLREQGVAPPYVELPAVGRHLQDHQIVRRRSAMRPSPSLPQPLAPSSPQPLAPSSLWRQRPPPVV